MNSLLQKHFKIKNAVLFSLVICSVLLAPGCRKKDEVPVLKISTIAIGLKGPIGMEIDKSGRVWVAEGGTGQNDGKVVIIGSDGRWHNVITNLESVNTDTGEPDGPTHLLFADGILYILGRHGKLYKANVASFKIGDAPINGASLPYEDIAAYVLPIDFKNETNDSHAYNLTKGPNGAIYIADAGANAILRRSTSGVLSVVAELPPIPNPTGVGGPFMESVPTGIIYDGQNFLVSTLTGFPFATGHAVVYKVSPTGTVSLYQKGFTTATDIAEGGKLGRLVLEFATFGPTGFMPNTGKLKWADGTSATLLTGGLNMPAGLKQADEHTWYVTSLADGTLSKVSY